MVFRNTNVLKIQPFVNEKFKMAKNSSPPLPSETIKVNTYENFKEITDDPYQKIDFIFDPILI